MIRRRLFLHLSEAQSADLVQWSPRPEIAAKWRCRSLIKIQHTGDKASLDQADSSTDAIGGWTKNTQKPDFFEKRKKSPKLQKLRNSRNMTKLAIRALTRGL